MVATTPWRTLMHLPTLRLTSLLLTAALSLCATMSCGGDEDEPGADADRSCGIGGTKCAHGCTPSLGCTECASDAECTDPGKPACVLGKCRECGPEASCGAAQACFPRDYKCETRCESDGDCPGDEPICVNESGTCVGCRTDADCASSPGTPICEPLRAQCSECASNADCGAANPACDLNDGKCHECLVDANCPPGTLCGVDRKCHRSCSSNADCDDAGKPFCDLGSHDCVACLVNTDCGSAEPICRDFKCVECDGNGDCVDPIAPICVGDRCRECGVDDDCADPAKPVCKGEICVQCDNDDDCTDPELPKCSNQECVAN